MADPKRGGLGSFQLSDVMSGMASVISDMSNTWMAPGRPPEPIAPPTAEGPRDFDYPIGYNLMRPPRQDVGLITFSEIKAMSKACEPVRLVIETIKDGFAKIPFTILPKKQPGMTLADRNKKVKGDDRVLKFMRFLEYPDGRDAGHDWPTWLRLIVDEMLVTDATTIFRRGNKGGGVYGLEVIDGQTISRVLDDKGRTPVAGAPAYVQWIKGLPAWRYTTDQMIYAPRNPTVDRVFGFSPVEQIILHTNIILNRNLSQLAQYTASNIPMLFLKAPKDWKPTDIAAFQAWFDSILTGDIEERSKAILIPDGADPMAPKKEALADDKDEWLMRTVTYAFGVSPNFFIRQQNRASSQSYFDQADAEGTYPRLTWVEQLLNRVMAKWFEMGDLEFEFQFERPQKPLEEAQTHQIYLTTKVMTIDEVRDALGMEPLTQQQKDDMLAMAPPPPQPFGGNNPDNVDETKPVKPGKALKLLRGSVAPKTFAY